MSPSESVRGTPIHDRRDGALAPSGTRRTARPRLRQFDYTGPSGYHIVAVTKNRRPTLVGPFADFAAACLERASRATGFDLLAYTIMPDHVHVLILGLHDDSHAVRFVQRFKQALGYRYAQRGIGPLWQESFFDHILRGDEDVLPIVRYIMENPVAAGLTATADAWPHTGGRLVEIARGSETQLSASEVGRS